MYAQLVDTGQKSGDGYNFGSIYRFRRDTRQRVKGSAFNKGAHALAV